MEGKNIRPMRLMIDAFNSGDLSKVESFIGSNYIDHQGLDGESIWAWGV